MMLCRVLLTIIAITYLICVLLLSGLQKEDLDVNMLKKLERHNVNIDDMNDEKLREECISKTAFREVDRKIEITTEAAKDDNDQSKSIRGLTKAQLKTIMQYLIDSKSDDQPDTGVLEKSTKQFTVTENYTTTLQVGDIKYDIDKIVKYNTPNNKNNYAEIEPMRNMEKYDVQKFIKLWNMYNKEYTKDSVNRKTVAPTFTEVETTTAMLKPYDKEKEIQMEYNMNKMIMDYMSKNKNNPTTASPPFTKNVILDGISYQIERYLAVNKDNTNSDMLNLLLNDMQRSHYLKNLQKKNEVANPYKESLKNKAKKYLSEIFSTDEQSNEQVVTEYGQIITERPYNVKNGFKLGVIKSSELHKYNIIDKINNKEIMDEKNTIKEVKVPVDIVKEIAESVKAIVLRDLKNDLSTVTPTITVTKATTEHEATKLKQENLQDSNNIMEKLMELFQQFKTMKEKGVISGDTKIKTTEKNKIQHEYNGRLKLGFPPPMPPINPYGVIMPTAQITPTFTNLYGQNSNLNLPYVHDSHKNNHLNSVHKITQVNIFHPKNEPQPLTIQTNSYEIAPLGIPVSKPFNMVNQNIVVTTKNPYMRPKIDRQHGNIMHHELDYNNKRNPNDWLHTYDMTNRQRTYGEFNLDKFKDPNRDTKYRTKSRERLKYTNDYNDNNQYRSGNYKPHFNKSDYDRMRLRNQEIKKFHERLERTEDSNIMDDREDCCRVKVASRQQLPLSSNIKNRSRYDDTHFRNFLKTQQKVNDMLERILATKTKSDGPRSVETP